MKKLFNLSILSFCFVALAFGLSSCGNNQDKTADLLSEVQERGYIKAGVKFDSKPFGYIDENQELKGFDIDLIKEIAKRILGSSTKVKFEQVNSSNRIFSLTSGSLDMVAATMTINDKRKRIIDFSQPYYIAGQAIMVPKDSDIQTVLDLNKKEVIVVLGSTSEKNLRELAPKAKIKGFRTYTDAFSALRANRGDALTTDDTIIAGFLLEDNNFKMLEERYTKEPYGIGFRKHENTQTFQDAINKAIDSMKLDGTLERIANKWISNGAKDSSK